MTREKATPAHTVVHDPHRQLEAKLPLDRVEHAVLLKTVLGWSEDPGLPTDDYQHLAQHLTGAAHAVADDVRAAAERLPTEHAARVLAEYVLDQTTRSLNGPLEGTAGCVRRRARCVRELYERLDRLASITPQPAIAP
ncbi:DUF6415 family natural product biosynthesis protein [Streptomyces sp. DB-54]